MKDAFRQQEIQAEDRRVVQTQAAGRGDHDQTCGGHDGCLTPNNFLPQVIESKLTRVILSPLPMIYAFRCGQGSTS